MWNRAELKGKAKFSFKRNYWKSVLISLLLALIVGGGGSGAGSAASGFRSGVSSSADDAFDLDYDDFDYDDLDNSYSYDDSNTIDDFAAGFQDGLRSTAGGTRIAELLIFGVTFVVLFLIFMAIVVLLDVFVCNPIEIGCKRFYLRNLNEPAQVGNIGYAFDNHYKNIAKTMFFRDLYTILWTLLFIIPGIVKSYEYQMIPYLLAENPQMSKEQAFAESKRMMDGQKWNAFVLDLSFIGWHILSGITCGLLGIFYVQPYVDATHAALYETLRYGAPFNGAQNYYNGAANNASPYTAPNGFTNYATDSIVEENPNQ